MTVKELQDFEDEIAKIYESGAIRGPIHLRDGNESFLIDIFREIDEKDYKFATWANHLEALLSGIPKEKVKERILEGRSMAMNFPEYRFYTSAIVGGICPIAVGTAWAIKQRKGTEKVWVFLGDMGVHCGIAHESIKYGIYNNLPIKWIISDNHKSVDTPTDMAWNNLVGETFDLTQQYNRLAYKYNKNSAIIYYKYKSKYPHSGIGSFVSF